MVIYLYKIAFIYIYVMITLNTSSTKNIAQLTFYYLIAAKSILPPRGDSTCAFNNQVLRNIVGVLTANAIKIP